MAVCNVLQNFKEKVNDTGYKWMTYLAEHLQKRNFNGRIVQGDIGSKLSSNGWDLIIGYTSNPDYKTHITMGILPTNDQQLNECILKVHENVERNIAVKFSSKDGLADKSTVIKLIKHLVENYRVKELKSLADDEIGEFSTLKVEARNAREGRTVQISKSLIDEWGSFQLRKIHQKLDKRNIFIGISRIYMSIINIAMVQNFEPSFVSIFC